MAEKRQSWRRLSAALGAASLALALSACSSTSSIPYPTLPGLGGGETQSTMSPEEQKGAIDDLTSAQAQNEAAAAGKQPKPPPEPPAPE